MVIIDDATLRRANLTEQELKIELAVLLYSQRKLSFGHARELAEMSFFEFEKLLFDRKIDNGYDLAEYERDVETLEKFRAGQ